jgi:murein DD-endopeptidase MepM/ murein hydrolase activator NlpD
MPKAYRLFALLLMMAFLASTASLFVTPGTSNESVARGPEILPAAIANPVDMAYHDTLQSGETLSELLGRAELAEGEAQALLGLLAEHSDPRRMRAGSVFAFRRSAQDGTLRRLEMRLDADRTLAIHRDGELWSGSIEEVPVTADTVVLTGTVQSSLYRALLEGDGSGVPTDERERLADILADRIFAWQVDFSRDLRTGDRFRILYERMVRPDGSARTGRVLSVQFNINSRDYEAYAFAPAGGPEDYFDRDGESLRRAFLRAPLQYRRISSAFSRSRFHPILRVNRPHNGVDYAAAAGTPVRAVGDGVVRRAGNGDGYGNVVDIAHTRGYMSRYAHLQRFAQGIRPGVRVSQGDIIGYVGMTGLATAPHLHYEFHSNGRAIDPNSIRDITGDPVPRTYLGQFVDIVQAYVASLDSASDGVLAAEDAYGPAPRLGD